MNAYTMKELPEAMRPRERLLAEGEAALSQVDLIAILLGSGTHGKPVLRLAEELLLHFGDLENLSDASVNELTQIQGMGPAKAVQIRAVFTLAERFLQGRQSLRTKIVTSSDAYHAVRQELERKKEERLAVLLHDAKGCSIGVELVSIGTLTQTLAHPREIFHPAIRHKAAALTVAHNHPSGDCAPSKEDLVLTRKLIGVGRMLDIPLFDHLILGKGSYVSIRDKWKKQGVRWS